MEDKKKSGEIVSVSLRLYSDKNIQRFVRNFILEEFEMDVLISEDTVFLGRSSGLIALREFLKSDEMVEEIIDIMPSAIYVTKLHDNSSDYHWAPLYLSSGISLRVF